jgi:glycosyltransferase involved in cell wall biosynthesis
MSASPTISVVIPTLRRPALILRALKSVFAQTYRDIEIVVVVDGPDDETIAALQAVDDPRLSIVVNPRSMTAAGARNIGVAHAKGEWVAFLDDDDEWLPEKLEKQIAASRGRESVLVSCRSRVVTPTATYIWPEVAYDNAEPLDEYLFDRRGPFAGSAWLQTSSFFLARALIMKAPFRVPSQHDDWDFVLHLSKQLNVTMETVPETLVVIHAEEERPSLSRVGGWRASLSWLDSVKSMMTARGYSGFCLVVVGPRAASEGAYAAFFPLLYRAFKNGSPRPWQLAAYLAFWLVPQPLRRRLRAWFRGVTPAEANSART